MGYLIAAATWILGIWLIRRDIKLREGLSFSIWIPTIWAFVLMSRSVTGWLGFGGGTDALEGSPLDRMFYFVMIFLAVRALARRRILWSTFITENWPIFLFYAYFLLTVMWAGSPEASFKRWFKDLGNVWVAAVILTETDPIQAVRAVFVRCAYILIPLSEVYIRYLPNLGRRYSRAGGLEITGVTTQKNALGITVLICGLVLLWDWFERTEAGRKQLSRFDRYMPFALLLLGLYLLYLCNSKTSMFCLAVGSVVLLAARVPVLRRRVTAIGLYTLLITGGFFMLDWLVGGIKEAVVGSLGRDMTFTGRTDVWRELLNLHTDPAFGTGFCNIWSDKALLDRLPGWVGGSAHNGYLETYLDGGMVGVFFLGLLICAAFHRANASLGRGGGYGLLRFAIALAITIGSFSESHFAHMGPLWFIFLLTTLKLPVRTQMLTVRTLDPVRRPTPEERIAPAAA